MPKSLIRAHIFTNIPSHLLLKQSRDFSNIVGNVNFSFGLEIPNEIDVLIVYTRASYSIQTTLPKKRTIFFAGEPDVIHPYKQRYLNQFGHVLTTSEKKLQTNKIRHATCYFPYVGINMTDWDNPMNLFEFESIDIPKKNNKISIVTSDKTYTEHHKKRVKFLEVLKAKIPDQLEIYGRGYRSIEDKKDALLPHKYHIALENGGGKYTWTEKMADPLICWNYTFYHGCDNLHEDIPEDSFMYIDIEKPDEAIRKMQVAVDSNLWNRRKENIAEARNLIFSKFNLMNKFAELANLAFQNAVKLEKSDIRKRTIFSERSLWPEPNTRGNYFETFVRSSLLFFDPKIELRASSFMKSIERKRTIKRNKKIEAAENQKNAQSLF